MYGFGKLPSTSDAAKEQNGQPAGSDSTHDNRKTCSCLDYIMGCIRSPLPERCFALGLLLPMRGIAINVTKVSRALRLKREK
jgi:hypothetical protein